METLNPGTVLLLILSAGAFGGVAELVRQISYTSGGLMLYSDRVHFYPSLCVMLVASALVGAAGAMGVQFIFILLKSFRADSTVDNIVLIISISVAAGFGARNILPGLARHLQRQIEEVKEDVEERASEFNERLRRTEEEVVDEAEFFAKITTASAVTDTPPSVRQWAINELTRLIQMHKTHRSFHIILARLHRLNGDLDTAINILDDFLANKNNASQRGDTDYADALYNKACYLALRFDQHGDEHDKIQAIEALRLSLQMLPENRNVARRDVDFASIEGEEDFQELLRDASAG